MKKILIGIVSGVLFVCILAGNLVFTIYENRRLSVQTLGKAADSDSVALPVLMYHHILENPKRQGDYVISPEQFEEDLKYIKSHGYTPISIAELLAYLEEQKPLPEKPIMITFDDGYESFYEYAFPLLQQYRMKAVLSIIGKYTDLYSGNAEKNVNYSHVSWTQLKEIQDSGLVEIGNHTYDLHKIEEGQRKGIQKLSDESEADYRKLLTEDIGSLNEEIAKELGIPCNIFAYPFGAFSDGSDSVLHELGFRVILTCEEKVNHLTPGEYNQTELLKLYRFNRPAKISTEEMFEKFGE